MSEAPGVSGGPRPPVKLVLDTNVVLDLLVFRDPGARPLARALHEGTAWCMSDASCAEELRRVLAYPAFRLDAAAARRVYDAYVRLATFAADAPAAPAGGLPRCKDPDDQKFLELSQRAGADLLVTKDKALLALARRAARDTGFRIVAPAAAAALLAPAAG